MKLAKMFIKLTKLDPAKHLLRSPSEDDPSFKKSTSCLAPRMSLLPPTWASLQGRCQRAASSNQHVTGVWAHVTHLTVSNTHPEPTEHKNGHLAPPPGVPSCGYGCCCLSSGLLDSVFKHCTLACENVCQLSHKSCSPMSMHFAKIGKMKTARAWAPDAEDPVGPLLQTLD